MSAAETVELPAGRTDEPRPGRSWAWPAILVGLCVGSFLNVVIYRLPKMMERQWAAECADLSGQADWYISALIASGDITRSAVALSHFLTALIR